MPGRASDRPVTVTYLQFVCRDRGGTSRSESGPATSSATERTVVRGLFGGCNGPCLRHGAPSGREASEVTGRYRQCQGRSVGRVPAATILGNLLQGRAWAVPGPCGVDQERPQATASDRSTTFSKQRCPGHGPLTRRVTTQGWTSGKMGCICPHLYCCRTVSLG